MQMDRLDAPQRAAFERDGSVILRDFANAGTTSAIHEAAIALARREAVDVSSAPNHPFVLPEANLRDDSVAHAEQAVSKVFRVHREEPFHSFATRRDLVATVARLIGTDALCCFL